MRKERLELLRYCYRQPLKLTEVEADRNRPRNIGVGCLTRWPFVADCGRVCSDLCCTQLHSATGFHITVPACAVPNGKSSATGSS